ncbi:uncharacterized protein LOC129740900 [Uranotaenia lowii]|uniref:uncharacterized protein LOC129740900 n=1 Tax=Uranotaenia lowii TaxID=190385 RepID=UPI00247AA024|nr:uncharacterized protein LOC129740900 [Uranotaenia lowii]
MSRLEFSISCQCHSNRAKDLSNWKIWNCESGGSESIIIHICKQRVIKTQFLNALFQLQAKFSRTYFLVLNCWFRFANKKSQLYRIQFLKTFIYLLQKPYPPENSSHHDSRRLPAERKTKGKPKEEEDDLEQPQHLPFTIFG